MKIKHNRAAEASKALAVYSAHTGIQDEDTELRISDLICDLQHLADMEKVDWPTVIQRASGHYIKEVQDEEEIDSSSR